MSAGRRPRTVRTEDELGPNRDKHALIVDGFREIHIGSWAKVCATCQETKRLASGGKE